MEWNETKGVGSLGKGPTIHCNTPLGTFYISHYPNRAAPHYWLQLSTRVFRRFDTVEDAKAEATAYVNKIYSELTTFLK